MGLGQLWQKALPPGSQVDVQPISPGGMGAPYLFESDNSDISFCNGAPAKWAWDTGVLGRPPTHEYRALVADLIAISAVNFLTEDFIKKHNVTTVEEVFRKKLPVRIGCSPKGSMDEQIVSMLCQYFNCTYDDIKSWGGDVIHGGGSDLSALVKDGKIDMMLDHTSAQSSTMTEIAMTANVRFMQWEQETLDWFYKNGFQPVELPANSFKGQTKTIVDAGSPDCIFVNVKMSDDVAYTLTKAMCENRDELVKMYSSMWPLNPKTAWEPMRRGGVPLHPGAMKYYKEMGYMPQNVNE
jgi:TRAP transporter TAXI family solute receptor